MSHYSKVCTSMKKLSALVSALQNVGFAKKNIEVSETLLSLKGYAGDYRAQKAHVRLKGSGWQGENVVGSASNDLGWECMKNGEYSFHVSDYDKKKYNEDWQQKLVQQYGVEVVKEEANEYGWEIEEEEVTKEGQIHLVLNAPYIN